MRTYLQLAILTLTLTIAACGADMSPMTDPTVPCTRLAADLEAFTGSCRVTYPGAADLTVQAPTAMDQPITAVGVAGTDGDGLFAPDTYEQEIQGGSGVHGLALIVRPAGSDTIAECVFVECDGQ